MKPSWGRRIPELDGFRAIAIWMVLLVHVLAFEDRPSLLFLPRSIREILSHGWLGVDLFFLLSGFLITGILLDNRGRRFYFKNFYIRRFLRIMPLYFAVVFVWSFAYHGHRSFFLLSSMFGANLAPLFHVRQAHGGVVLWSLAVEEHFYLVWPAIVFLLDRRKVLILCAVLFVTCPILRGIFAARGMDREIIYVLSWFRLDGLAAGAALAIWVRSEWFSRRSAHLMIGVLIGVLCAITIAGLPFAVFVTKSPAAVALRYTQAYLIFGSFFVLTLAYLSTKWTSPLGWSFLQLSGALSYCLYLIHLSVGDLFQFLYAHQHRVHLAGDALVLTRGAFMIAASFGIAMLSQAYFEGPILTLKDRFTSRKPTEPVELIPALARAS
jgi:peptidoglycan/LPS O-acetylase OafA/YrhL